MRVVCKCVYVYVYIYVLFSGFSGHAYSIADSEVRRRHRNEEMPDIRTTPIFSHNSAMQNYTTVLNTLTDSGVCDGIICIPFILFLLFLSFSL